GYDLRKGSCGDPLEREHLAMRQPGGCLAQSGRVSSMAVAAFAHARQSARSLRAQTDAAGAGLERARRGQRVAASASTTARVARAAPRESKSAVARRRTRLAGRA